MRLLFLFAIAGSAAFLGMPGPARAANHDARPIAGRSVVTAPGCLSTRTGGATGPRMRAVRSGAATTPLEATCCRPPARQVVRNDEPLSRWVLAESDLGDASTEDAPSENGRPPKDADAAVRPTSVPDAPRALQPVVNAARAARDPAENGARGVLARWSDASWALEPLCPARVRRLVRHLPAERRGHESEWLAWFQGPVDEDELHERLTWSLVSSENGRTTLAGVPNDPVERLFVPRLELTLDSAGLPAEIRFLDRQGAPRGESIAMTERRLDDPLRDRLPEAAAADTNGPGVVRQTTALVRTADRGEGTIRRPVTNAAPSSRESARADERGDRGSVRLVGASSVEFEADQILSLWSRAVAEREPILLGSVTIFDGSRHVPKRRAVRPPVGDDGRGATDPEPIRSDDGKVKSEPVAKPVSAELLRSIVQTSRPEDLKARFQIDAIESGATESAIKLTPIVAADHELVGSIELMLSATTGRPIAARAVDPTGRFATFWTASPSRK